MHIDKLLKDPSNYQIYHPGGVSQSSENLMVNESGDNLLNASSTGGHVRRTSLMSLDSEDRRYLGIHRRMRNEMAEFSAK